MKKLVRRSSLGFAIASVLYWLFVIELRETLSAAAYGNRPSLLQDWLTTGLPAIIYGLLSVVFTHWFARKIISTYGAE